MHFDIVEAVRQKQFKHQQSISIENGDLIDISITDGTVVISPGVPQGPIPGEGEQGGPQGV